MLSKRTKISLAQFLELQNINYAKSLLERCDIHIIDVYSKFLLLKDSLLYASNDDILSLFRDIVSTRNDLRSRITPKYRFDERWNDLEKCLALDGIDIKDNEIVTVDSFDDGTNARMIIQTLLMKARGGKLLTS